MFSRVHLRFLVHIRRRFLLHNLMELPVTQAICRSCVVSCCLSLPLRQILQIISNILQYHINIPRVVATAILCLMSHYSKLPPTCYNDKLTFLSSASLFSYSSIHIISIYLLLIYINMRSASYLSIKQLLLATKLKGLSQGMKLLIIVAALMGIRSTQ